MTIQRRDFITFLGTSAAAWPLAAGAQQSERMRRIGVLMSGKPTDATYQMQLKAFVEALQKLSWSDGQNVRIDTRWSAAEDELARFYAAELIALAPEVILVGSTGNLNAVQRVTRTIPVVFTGVSAQITLKRCIFRNIARIKLWPPNPGLTFMTRIMSHTCST